MRTYFVGAALAQLGDDLAPIHYVLGAFALVGGLAFVVWLISLGVASGVKSANAQKPPPARPTPAGAFPVVMDDGPGTFRVSGVDRETSLDVTDHIAADSPANAKVKAELRGIVVTKIERV